MAAVCDTQQAAASQLPCTLALRAPAAGGGGVAAPKLHVVKLVHGEQVGARVVALQGASAGRWAEGEVEGEGGRVAIIAHEGSWRQRIQQAALQAAELLHAVQISAALHMQLQMDVALSRGDQPSCWPPAACSVCTCRRP